MISVVLFIYWPEEEELVEACLKTVAWADEIVVIDNGATQKTLELVKQYTRKIYKDDSVSFAARHNHGQELAKGDWILFIDADERISARLALEIQSSVKTDSFAAYQLPRIHYFLGREARFGDRFPDFVTRLFKKISLVGWEGNIHESSKVDGKIGRLREPFYHLTHRDIFSMMEKTINFADQEAKLKLESKHPQVVWWRLVRVFITEWYKRMIRLQGWRGGTEGWIDGIFQSFSMFVVYARLWELQRKPTLTESYREIDQRILKEFK